MSLINDALKRAKQAHTENPTPTPDLPFRAAEPVTNRNSGAPLLPVAVLVIAVVLGGGLILLALQKRDAHVVHATQADAKPASTLSPVAEVPTASPTTTATTPAAQGEAPKSAAQMAEPLVAAQSSGPASSSTVDAPIAAVAPEPPKPGVPKLQGIFYNPSRPSAVVNGKTVYVGSRAGEARDFLVLEIGRQSVTVANGSQTNVLVLEE